MNTVFFNESLHARAPKVIGVLFLEKENQWVGLAEVVDAVRRGEVVTIRPASDVEMSRAEAIVSTFEVGQQISKNIQTLYDNKGPDEVEDAIFNLHQAVMSVNFADFVLIDKA